MAEQAALAGVGPMASVAGAIAEKAVRAAMQREAAYGVVENAPGPVAPGERAYSLRAFMEQWRTSENALMLAFSGGGTRAAALSYGVLKELRDTPVHTETGTRRLLDEVHTISSVSGGSFTSAYYGLHGDGIFDDYEEVFLRKNVEGSLIRRVLNPLAELSAVPCGAAQPE